MDGGGGDEDGESKGEEDGEEEASDSADDANKFLVDVIDNAFANIPAFAVGVALLLFDRFVDFGDGRAYGCDALSSTLIDRDKAVLDNLGRREGLSALSTLSTLFIIVLSVLSDLSMDLNFNDFDDVRIGGAATSAMDGIGADGGVCCDASFAYDPDIDFVRTIGIGSISVSFVGDDAFDATSSASVDGVDAALDAEVGDVASISAIGATTGTMATSTDDAGTDGSKAGGDIGDVVDGDALVCNDRRRVPAPFISSSSLSDAFSR